MNTLHIRTDIGAFNELPEKIMILEALELGVGTLNQLCAVGNAGKTMLLQHLNTCVATGLPFLGTFPVKRGKVLHIDQEQSEEQTHTRYIRIGAGLNVPSFDIDLETIERMPAVLTDTIIAKYKTYFTNLFSGYAFVTIDSLRAITLADENSGEMEPILKMLKAVAADVGCCLLLIHHKGKHQTAAVQTGRGHSSLYDSIDVQIDLDKHADMQFELRCQKIRDGKEFSTICFTFTDEGEYVARRRCSHKLRFKHLETIATQTKAKVFAAISDKLIINVSDLLVAVGGQRSTLIATLSELEEAGLISCKIGQKNAKNYSPTPKGYAFFKVTL